MKNIYKLILCAFFAALTAAFSQIGLPIGPVPINLATLAVFTAGALLGPGYGALSMVVYVLLGVAGAPVFSALRGGIGVLAGPTGGYIIGYIACAWLTGLITARGGNRFWRLVLGMVAGYLLCLALGTGWYMYSTKNGLASALGVCVLPFLAGDALKTALAAVLAQRLLPALKRQR